MSVEILKVIINKEAVSNNNSSDYNLHLKLQDLPSSKVR